MSKLPRTFRSGESTAQHRDAGAFVGQHLPVHLARVGHQRESGTCEPLLPRYWWIVTSEELTLYGKPDHRGRDVGARQPEGRGEAPIGQLELTMFRNPRRTPGLAERWQAMDLMSDLDAFYLTTASAASWAAASMT